MKPGLSPAVIVLLWVLAYGLIIGFLLGWWLT